MMFIPSSLGKGTKPKICKGGPIYIISKDDSYLIDWARYYNETVLEVKLGPIGRDFLEPRFVEYCLMYD